MELQWDYFERNCKIGESFHQISVKCGEAIKGKKKKHQENSLHW